MTGIIAVDFDGTLCQDCYPNIGHANVGLIEYLKKRQKEGWKVILWTCRTADELDAAVRFCLRHKLKFDAVNDNVAETIEKYGGNSRKIYADVYIDDKAWQPWWSENDMAVG